MTSEGSAAVGVGGYSFNDPRRGTSPGKPPAKGDFRYTADSPSLRLSSQKTHTVGSAMKPRGFSYSLVRELDDGSDANPLKLSFANGPKQTTSGVRAFEATLTGGGSGSTMLGRHIVPVNEAKQSNYYKSERERASYSNDAGTVDDLVNLGGKQRAGDDSAAP
jgi:hypothetical protein